MVPTNKTMSRTGRFSFPVAAVISVIAYIIYVSVFVFINQWFGLVLSPGIINSVVFTAVAIMCCFNYYMAICTDPGRVPVAFTPDLEDADNQVQEIKRKSGDLRHCQKCSQYKPPRTHHCRVCKRCVLRMDHHCIWISNCVGHANYEAFFVFVVYAVIACFYSLILLVGSLTVDDKKDEEQNEGSSQTTYVISGILLVPLCMALSILLGWHIYLTLRNKTTIEYHEGVRALWLDDKGGQVYVHPYDLGAFENLTSVLGPSILRWLCPTSGHIGSGIRFRTSYDKTNNSA